MRQLGSIYPHEVDPSLPPQDYASYTDRPAGRAIIFDGERVALIHVSASGYYMLPGGGLDGEDVRSGLGREVLEETGMRIELLNPVGSIAVYFDRWHKRQIDDCFMARLVGKEQAVTLTDFETTEGYGLVWVSTLQGAIELMERTVPDVRDGKLVRARDLLFLRTAAHQVALG
jgi:8-oxo-dGTP pyrophosphatase MutT (NUDIX family)